jgi:hypothetical protein
MLWTLFDIPRQYVFQLLPVWLSGPMAFNPHHFEVWQRLQCGCDSSEAGTQQDKNRPGFGVYGA